jgi:methyl-accepting chemotaxis protein
MLGTLKIRDRILWGYSVPIALSIGAAVLVYFNVQTVREKSQQVEFSQINVENSKELKYSMARMQGTMRGYLLVKNDTTLASYEKAEKAFDQLTKFLPPRVKDKQQQQRIERIIEIGNRFKGTARNVFSLVERGERNQAIEFWKASTPAELVREYDQLTQYFEETEQALLVKQQQAANQSLEFLNTVVFSSAALSAILAIIIALWLTSRLSQVLNESVSAIATSSTEIAATVEQQERTAAQQSAAVNQTTITMDELGASSQQSAQQAQAAAEAARQALKITEGGTLAVEQNLESMTILKEKVGAIATQIMRLNEQTNQIGNISSVVTDLANQTNMLAINASIEAVRAGENGKGFSVLATEIRKLADISKKSAEKINNLVADIKNALDSTVTVTNEGTKTVEEGNKISLKTAAAFSEVTKAFNNVVLNNQQISLTTQQQAVAIQQVVDAMNSLNLLAKETASGITQTKVGAQQLKDAAQSLNSIV